MCAAWPRLQLQAAPQPRAGGFRSQAWYPLVWGRRSLPVEPILKVALTFVGINAELWAGHTSYRCGVEAHGPAQAFPCCFFFVRRTTCSVLTCILPCCIPILSPRRLVPSRARDLWKQRLPAGSEKRAGCMRRTCLSVDWSDVHVWLPEPHVEAPTAGSVV